MKYTKRTSAATSPAARMPIAALAPVESPVLGFTEVSEAASSVLVGFTGPVDVTEPEMKVVDFALTVANPTAVRAEVLIVEFAAEHVKSPYLSWENCPQSKFDLFSIQKSLSTICRLSSPRMLSL